MDNVVLSAQEISIGYNPPRRPAVVVAENLSVSLVAGELVCLIGPNGAGKSTLMRTLAGMQPTLRGCVYLGHDNISTLKPDELARRVSVVLTERVNVGHLSAYELVGLGRYPYSNWTGQLSDHDQSVIRWAIEAVGARHLAGRVFNELSDGERQKIMIARALAQEPGVMLLDEPTAFLDLPNRVETMRVLRQLTRQTERAILLSTHDLDLALRTADRIWIMPHKAPLHVGAPEDLILSGAFEAAFRSEGAIFDSERGAFKIIAKHTKPINLSGEGLDALWTQRALERAGFTVSQDHANGDVRVEVISENDHRRWRSTIHNQGREHNSIYDLITHLRQENQPSSPNS
ncbi:MAG: ABC transporter ATP-binding protein [Anaerolineae bacterium]|nr:ABC transporter ATP-binding protein [Anaerolineae bacterium]